MASSSFASSRYIKSCLKYTTATLATVFTASMTAATYYRPVPANLDNNSTHTNTHSNDRRAEQTFCSPESPPWNRDHVPLLLQWARGISIGATTLAIRLVMNTYGRYHIKEDEHYRNFLHAAITARREQQHQQSDTSSSSLQQTSIIPQRGLLTVSNHRSLFDDPGILSCLLPLPIAIQPRHQRWGICSQEYCFNDALPSFVKGYIGAGQVLPICRGGGINQQLLLDFGRHLVNGEWCHVFPEGGVWQWKELGGRRQLPEGGILGSASDFADDQQLQQQKQQTKKDDTTTSSDNNNNNKSIIIPATKQHKSLPLSPSGKLKWGVGKLIAHAPITPRVIPFAHCGMERLLPQDEISGKTYLRTDFVKSLLPSFLLGNSNDDDGSSSGDGKGLQIRIQFGHEINFDDLIQEHETKHGKLWKYRGKEPTTAASMARQVPENWVSSKEERILYSKIVKRIEMHLEVLTKEVCADQ
jgi:monolysocardiolipin acyltransferase